ncbi:hypothetical protein ACFU93_32495 [Streptomyces sp. NPDC057611]|uniref:hypothetical protein n=1 Tax=Streptomyces sp. NPDC057611 TaxID=3346182 RepID=UPI003690B429
MDATTLSAIFSAAATATSWQQTTLGPRATVAHDGQDWTVQLPKGSGKAYIAGSTGYGGHTPTFVEATWAETFPIVEAAMAAARLH